MLQHQGKAEKPTGRSHASQGFRTVLVAIDLSQPSDRALGRVSLLPLSDDCRITLLHVLPKGLSAGDRRSAEEVALTTLEGLAKGLGPKLPKNASVETLVKVGAPASDIALCAEAKNVDLIVVGRGSPRMFRDTFLGTTAENVVRRARRTVLVVRLDAHAPYRRPALAVDAHDGAHEAVALLLRAIPAPRPIVSVIHAVDLEPQEPISPSLSDDEAHEQRVCYQQKIARELTTLLRSAVARANVAQDDAPWWLTHVRHGSPRMIIKEDVKSWGADLLVLGTHAHGNVVPMLLGTVAGQVLREVDCDVLVTGRPSPTPRPTRLA